MADKKISDLVELTTLADTDVLPVVDASANATKRVTYDTLATEVRTELEPLSATTVTASGDVSATTVTASGDITSNGETVYHRGNVVGTVSESGGTPTGAVIERDSNANGEYAKFADGTAIAQATHVFDFTNSNIQGPEIPITLVGPVGMAWRFSTNITGATDDKAHNVFARRTGFQSTTTVSTSPNPTIEVFYIGRWY